MNVRRCSLSVFNVLVVLISVGCVVVTNAFHVVTAARIATTPRSSSPFGGGRINKDQQPWTTKRWDSGNQKKRSSLVLLQMGVMEDFLTGQDQGKRIQANKEYLSSLQIRVDNVNALESSIEELDDDELQSKTIEFKKRLTYGEDINGPVLEEAFAVVREAAWYVYYRYMLLSVCLLCCSHFFLLSLAWFWLVLFSPPPLY